MTNRFLRKAAAYCRFLFWDGWRHPTVTKYAKCVRDIDFDALDEAGVELIIFDVDDTLMGFNDAPTPEILAFLRALSSRFRLACLSNAKRKRQETLGRFFAGISIFVQTSADKPAPEGYRAIMAHEGIEATRTAMVGDRVSMDLGGAQGAGITTRILVDPYSDVLGGKRATAAYRALRAVEKILFV